ncbi:DUF4249 domain-containing protein [Reichenbachiella sp. MSK19-1]|uniref:DUF4249 domain-containing protein n=1 Tax=Reichenbachiella sp. MSK19-1 TaxID=1897631 RepID=UPI000E6C4590|nr:DUF4249 domain-containing protein [Reichenbachiella sp. MSK19-1]RJE70665.1 hypothetical protein BGP76_11335 [Reichenbachiella sp. MSK19-1]
MKRVLFYLLFIVVASSCIENLGVFKGRNGDIVIEGVITNEFGPHIVKLATTKEFGAPTDYYLVQGANVTIEDNLGGVIDLENIGEGKYQTPENFRAELGGSYRLRVVLRSGEEFESSFESLNEVPTIDKVYHRIEQRSVLSSSDVLTEESVVVFYADFNNPKDVDNFYRWRYKETYQVFSPLAGNREGDVLQSRGCTMAISHRDCWVDKFDTEFLNITNDGYYDGLEQLGHEVFFTDIDKKFAIGYSANIQLYSLSEQAYEYWAAIEKQAENSGSIFDTSNFQIKGNVSSIDDPEQLVLGYFGVSGVASQRVMLINYEVPYTHTYVCEANNSGCYPVNCIDCTAYGASSRTTKPDYWK